MTTPEEFDDIKTFVVLPMLLDLIDKWMWFSDNTPLKHLHKDQFQQLLDLITLDHIEVKQRLKKADIKVVRDVKISTSYDYKLYVRRYEENVRFWKGHIKSEISVRLGKYVARLDKSKFKEQPKIEVKAPVSDRSLFVDF